MRSFVVGPVAFGTPRGKLNPPFVDHCLSDIIMSSQLSAPPSRTSRPWVGFAKNVSYNLAGQMVPLLAGLLAVPILLHTLGLERMGVLAIAWLVVGYSGLLDLGLSRSITQIAAEQMGESRSRSAAALLWTALVFSGVLSIAGTALAWGLTAPLLHMLNLSAELRAEVLVSLRLFCFSIPPAILASILLGFLTAYGRFGLINAIKIPTGLLMIAGPLLSVALGSRSLVPVMGILVGARWLTLLIIVMAAAQVEPSVRVRPIFEVPLLRQMLRLGSWITITNVVSPVLVYCDRFLIGSLLSVTAVAYYTTPQDTITKLLALPAAMVGVLFPYIASQHKTDRDLCLARSRNIVAQIFILLFPVIAVTVIFAQAIMTLWLGAEFADQSYRLLQLFALGALINALAQVPATMLQGVGKPKWPALIHLTELLLYVPASFLAIRHWGLAGAALVWGARILFDVMVLIWVVQWVWGIKAFWSLGDLLPMLGLTGLLVLHIALGAGAHPIISAIVLLTVFLLLYRRPIVTYARNAMAWDDARFP